MNGSKYAMFIGLNPSTADETKDDPTIRRCIGFAKAWGYGALCMTNLFAWRDTYPAGMKLAADPIGEENDLWLQRVAMSAGIIIAAWGTHGNFKSRNEAVIGHLSGFAELHHLGLSKDGHPRHPLYLSKACIPEPLTP